MPRVTIYVPEPMKSELDRLAEVMNWSATAQSAFTAEIIRHKLMGALTMDNVVERLRHSKAQYEKAELETGKQYGREWAAKHAQYGDLKRLVKADDRHVFDEDPDDWSTLIGSVLKLDDDEIERHPFYDAVENRVHHVSDDYARAWIEGVLEVWSEVEEQL